MVKLSALGPPPRVHLTRYHGVCTPRSTLGGRSCRQVARRHAEARAAPQHVAMSWARRLKRLFAIKIETCARCQGRLRVIASIEESELIERILAHRERSVNMAEPEHLPKAARAPPRHGLPL